MVLGHIALPMSVGTSVLLFPIMESFHINAVAEFLFKTTNAILNHFWITAFPTGNNHSAFYFSCVVGGPGGATRCGGEGLRLPLVPGCVAAGAAARSGGDLPAEIGAPRVRPDAAGPPVPAGSPHPTDLRDAGGPSYDAGNRGSRHLHAPPVLQHPIFRPEDWSVFRQTIRTNNDVEGKLQSSLINQSIKPY